MSRVETLWRTSSKKPKPQIQNGYYIYCRIGHRHRIVDVGFDRDLRCPKSQGQESYWLILPSFLVGSLYCLS